MKFIISKGYKGLSHLLTVIIILGSISIPLPEQYDRENPQTLAKTNINGNNVQLPVFNTHTM